MPSEPTPSRVLAWTNARWSRRALGGLIATGLGATLTSCSTGSRGEAERAREQDAERTSVVESMQQTVTAGLVKGTPPATPTGEPDE
jgi:hypothetical protein